MSLEQAKRYLARALPWPQDGEPPAFVNIHWTFAPTDHTPGKAYPWTGRAARNLNEAVNAVEWALKSPTTRDVYACLSTQRTATEKTGKNGYRYFTPVRAQANAVAIKTLYLDIDYKSYTDRDEAVREFARFLRETKLPKPTILVQSGGGLHSYWTLSRALTLAEWQPLSYALAEATKQHNLKCDTQCTVDGARVLRIPSTLNRKLDEPRPVTLSGDAEIDYTPEAMAQALEPYKTRTPALVTQQVIIPAPSPSVLAKFKGFEQNLSEGIGSRHPPIKLADIAAECAFVGDAIATHGAAYPQPMWHLTTLIATFTEGGIADAHLMSSGHPGYGKGESTDVMYGRKEREKAEKGLGWASCDAISAAGCTACQSCKHFAAGKTPFHTVLRAAAPAQLAPQATSQVTSQVSDLPNGYTRGADGIVWCTVYNKNDEPSQEPLSSYSMETDPWIQKPENILHFRSKLERGRIHPINIPLELVGTFEGRKYLQKQGFMLPTGKSAPDRLWTFMSSWIKQLRDTKDSVQSVPYGWNRKGSAIEGFVYAGRIWQPSGNLPAAASDPVLAQQFTPVGKVQPWYDAAKMIVDQKRPALEAILASAFAAPLVQFTSESGCLLSTWSKESGIGKTTALKVAQAVWGDPTSAICSLDDTKNYVMHKLGQLRHLPLYWDEIKSDLQIKKLVEIVFEVAKGNEKGRMTRSITLKEMGRWKTLMLTCNNDSLLDYIVNRTNTTTAGIYRVLEWTVPPATNVGQLDAATAQGTMSKLDNNYGLVGVMYAKWLGANHAQIDADMAAEMSRIERDMSVQAAERYWLVSITALMLGAQYANMLNLTNFDVEELRKFLYGVLSSMRLQINNHPVDMGKEINLTNVMGQYLSYVRSKDALLVTDRMHVGKGKPPLGSVKILTEHCDPQRVKSVYVQYGKDNALVRMVDSPLREWLRTKGYSPHVITEAMRDEYKARGVSGRIGAGSDKHSGTTEYLFEISLHDAKGLDMFEWV